MEKMSELQEAAIMDVTKLCHEIYPEIKMTHQEGTIADKVAFATAIVVGARIEAKLDAVLEAVRGPKYLNPVNTPNPRTTCGDCGGNAWTCKCERTQP